MTDIRGYMKMLKKTILAIGLFAAFATLAAPATAKPPSKADKRGAAQECKAERGTEDATREAFKAKYGNLGKCVSVTARERKAERKEARSNASQDCRAERDELGTDAFREQYGTNGNKRNAFGKCVSGKVKEELEAEEEQEEQETEETHNAAKTCAAERDTAGEEAFAEQYGTNGNKRNAFGKCVSAQAGGEDEEEAA